MKYRSSNNRIKGNKLGYLFPNSTKNKVESVLTNYLVDLIGLFLISMGINLIVTHNNFMDENHFSKNA